MDQPERACSRLGGPRRAIGSVGTERTGTGLKPRFPATCPSTHSPDPPDRQHRGRRRFVAPMPPTPGLFVPGSRSPRGPRGAGPPGRLCRRILRGRPPRTQESQRNPRRISRAASIRGPAPPRRRDSHLDCGGDDDPAGEPVRLESLAYSRELHPTCTRDLHQSWPGPALASWRRRIVARKRRSGRRRVGADDPRTPAMS